MGSCGEALQDVDECLGRQRWVVVEQGGIRRRQQRGAKNMGNVMGMYWSAPPLDCAVLACVFKLRQSGITGCQLGKIIRLPRTPSSC